MENLLGINPEDRPGQRKSGENVPGGKELESKDAKKEEESKDEDKKRRNPLSKNRLMACV